jgi:hypothetical protein
MFPPRDVPHNPADHPDQPSIQMKSVVFRQAGDGRFILVKGYISALGTSGELYVIAAPTNGEPARPAASAGGSNPAAAQPGVQRWYVSGPILINPDGSWEARIDIDPGESRDLSVEAVLMSLCEYLPKGAPRCQEQARAGPGDPLVTPPPQTSSPNLNQTPDTSGPNEHGDEQGAHAPAAGHPEAAIKHSLERNGPQSAKAVSKPTTVPTHS